MALVISGSSPVLAVRGPLTAIPEKPPHPPFPGDARLCCLVADDGSMCSHRSSEYQLHEVRNRLGAIAVLLMTYDEVTRSAEGSSARDFAEIGRYHNSSCQQIS
jgi:hypothetical protein